MKSLLIFGIATCAFGTAAMAQYAPQQPPVQQTAPAAPSSPDSNSTSPDPNAGQPTGQVPPAAQQMQPAPADVPKNSDAPEGTAANPVEMGGNMTPPAAPKDKYPLCSRTVKDECMNPSEAPGHHAMRHHANAKRHH